MDDKVSEIIALHFSADSENVYIGEGDDKSKVSPMFCVESINCLKNFVVDSPALDTLAREVEVPDRHTTRTIIEEMQIAVNEGVTPAQLGFWISELASIRKN